MYIEKTTAQDRFAVSWAVDSIFGDLERAHRLLIDVWEDHFSAADPKEICSGTVEQISDMLYVIDDIIFTALVQYKLTVGEDGIGVEPHLKSLQRAVKSREVEDLLQKLCDRERGMARLEQQEAVDMRKQIMSLPDDQALPALQAILDGNKVP